ncbi:MAG TPA: LpqB family beta-propeller domain-containing protein [Prosthecobacter sp.]|nr:LpqB family beta-propeller domain-containing protein [Prosthecobacter sp.]
MQPPSSSSEPFFKVGGTIGVNIASYVPRAADEEIFSALMKGDLCYVLTSRQMGKSSLMTRCSRRLIESGVTSVVLDLQRGGTELNAEQWYNFLIDRTATALRLRPKVNAFREANPRLSPFQLWMEVLIQVVLVEAAAPVVIFVDEIDLVRRFSFGTDEFFAGIRELYNRRTLEPDLCRLTFCLLGVASPADLIHDKRITPFNVGRRIELNDLQPAEARLLSHGFAGRDPAVAERLVDRVMHWTGGQPYLTQKLASEVAARPDAVSDSHVDACCGEIFFSPEGLKEFNIAFVRDRLLGEPHERERLLDLYRRVLHGKPVPDEAADPAVAALKLSGAVREENGRLVIKNRVYARIFDAAFIKANYPVNWARRLRQAALASAAILLFACLPLAIFAWSQKMEAESGKLAAEQSAEDARKARDQAVESGAKAELARKEADRLREQSEKDRARFQDLLKSSTLKDLKRAEADARLVEAQAAWLFGKEHVWVARHFHPTGRTSDRASWQFSSEQARVTEGRESLPARPRLPTVRPLTSRMVGAGVESMFPGPAGVGLFAGTVLERERWDVDHKLFYFAPSGDAVEHGSHNARSIFTHPDMKAQVCAEAGSVLVTFCPKEARLWDIAAGKSIGDPIAFEHEANEHAFPRRSAEWLALEMEDHVLVRHIATGKETRLAFSPGAYVEKMAASADGSWLAAILVEDSKDDRVQLWRRAPEGVFQSGALIVEKEAAGLEFSPGGGRLLVRLESGAVVHDVESGKQIGPKWQEIEEDDKISWSQDETMLQARREKMLENGYLRKVRLNNKTQVEGDDLLVVPDTLLRHVCLSPDGKLAVTSGFDDALRLTYLDGSSPVVEKKEAHEDNDINMAAFSPDGRLLASVADDNHVQLWSVPDLQPVASLAFSSSTAMGRSVVFDAKGSLVMAGDDEGYLSAWRVADRVKAWGLKVSEDDVTDLRVSPDGTRLALTSSNEVIVLDITAETKAAVEVSKWSAGTDVEYLQAAWSPDGTRLAAAGSEGAVHVWDMTGKLEFGAEVQTREDTPTLAALFWKDGQELIFGGTQNVMGSLRLDDWDQNPQFPDAVGDGVVASLALLPDGQTVLASGSGILEKKDLFWSEKDGAIAALPAGTRLQPSLPEAPVVAEAAPDGLLDLSRRGEKRAEPDMSLRARLVDDSRNIVSVIPWPGQEGRLIAAANHGLLGMDAGTIMDSSGLPSLDDLKLMAQKRIKEPAPGKAVNARGTPPRNNIPEASSAAAVVEAENPQEKLLEKIDDATRLLSLASGEDEEVWVLLDTGLILALKRLGQAGGGWRIAWLAEVPDDVENLEGVLEGLGGENVIESCRLAHSAATGHVLLLRDEQPDVEADDDVLNSSQASVWLLHPAQAPAQGFLRKLRASTLPLKGTLASTNSTGDYVVSATGRRFRGVNLSEWEEGADPALEPSLIEPGEIITALGLDPFVFHLAVGTRIGEILLYEHDAKAGEWLLRERFPAHPGAVTSICWSSDGRWFASADDNGLVRFWNAAPGAFAAVEQSTDYPTLASLAAAWGVDYDDVGDIRLKPRSDGIFQSCCMGAIPKPQPGIREALGRLDELRAVWEDPALEPLSAARKRHDAAFQTTVESVKALGVTPMWLHPALKTATSWLLTAQAKDARAPLDFEHPAKDLIWPLLALERLQNEGGTSVSLRLTHLAVIKQRMEAAARPAGEKSDPLSPDNVPEAWKADLEYGQKLTLSLLGDLEAGELMQHEDVLHLFLTSEACLQRILDEKFLPKDDLLKLASTAEDERNNRLAFSLFQKAHERCWLSEAQHWVDYGLVTDRLKDFERSFMCFGMAAALSSGDESERAQQISNMSIVLNKWRGTDADFKSAAADLARIAWGMNSKQTNARTNYLKWREGSDLKKKELLGLVEAAEKSGRDKAPYELQLASLQYGADDPNEAANARRMIAKAAASLPDDEDELRAAWEILEGKWDTSKERSEMLERFVVAVTAASNWMDSARFVKSRIAAAHREEWELADAITLFERVASDSVDLNAWCHAELADTYRRQGRLNTALEHGDKSIQLDATGDHWAWARRAEVKAELGRWEEALADITEASRLRMQSEDANDYTQAHALLLAQKGDFDLALKLLEPKLAKTREDEASNAGNGDADWLLNQADVLVWQAAASGRGIRVPESQELGREVLRWLDARKTAKDAELQSKGLPPAKAKPPSLVRIRANLHEGNYQTAVQLAEERLQTWDHEVEAHLHHAAALSAAGRGDQALAAIARALSREYYGGHSNDKDRGVMPLSMNPWLLSIGAPIKDLIKRLELSDGEDEAALAEREIRIAEWIVKQPYAYTTALERAEVTRLAQACVNRALERFNYKPSAGTPSILKSLLPRDAESGGLNSRTLR